MLQFKRLFFSAVLTIFGVLLVGVFLLMPFGNTAYQPITTSSSIANLSPVLSAPVPTAHFPVQP